MATSEHVERRWLYAIIGLVFGISAPIVWIFLRLIIFWEEGKGVFEQIIGDIIQSPQSISLYIYMGFGTSMVLATLGYFLGRANQQILDRAKRLDQLNRDVARQKEEFEIRFRDLNQAIKSFHSINADLQKSMNASEVLKLAGDGLHDIMGYDRVNVLMVNRANNCFDFVVSRGFEGEVPENVDIPLDNRAGALYLSYAENRPLLVEDVSRMDSSYHLQAPCEGIPQLRSKNFIIFPIVVRDEVVGLFSVDNKKKKRPLDDTDLATVKLFANQISASLAKISLLDGVEQLTGELETTFQELLRYRSDYAQFESSLQVATRSNAMAIADVAGAADVVREAVDTTRSAVGEISVSINQVSQNLSQLTDFMEKSISSMTQISQTIKEVKNSGANSHSMSETVRVQAEKGVSAMADAQSGLQQISCAVDKTYQVIGRLIEKSDEVDSITAVINEITQKTNLLALNAAIIAAQAGEHGRSFAVVAEEVRNLSQEAATSTGKISRVIGEIQEYTRDTGEQITITRELVQEGIILGQGVDASLRQILESAAVAMDMALDIRNATEEVARSAEFVTRSIEQLGEMSAQISLASQEQAHGTQSIAKSVEDVKAMAEDMVNATSRQLQNTEDIEAAVRAVSDMAQRIFQAMEERQQGSREVIESLELLKRHD